MSVYINLTLEVLQHYNVRFLKSDIIYTKVCWF